MGAELEEDAMDEFMNHAFRGRQFDGDRFVGFGLFKAGQHLQLARPKPWAEKSAVAPAEGGRLRGWLGKVLLVD
jgi:hypothetical protein